jgi:ubiquitin-protein ligase
MSQIIPKDTIHRLLKDVKQIMKNPLTDNGIYYIHDDVDMLKGYALIIGPSDTPYFGGYYFFELSYPSDYPYSPPKVLYCTNGNNVRFNPNLYICGKVCISLLNTWQGDQWTSCQTISTVLLTLCTLLCKDPLLNEPNVTQNDKDMNNYNEIITYSNLNVAISDIVMRKKGVFLNFFEYFYPYIRESFNNNYEKYVEIAEKRNEEHNRSIVLYKTQYYSLSVLVDYTNLIEKLKKTKEYVVNS